MDNMECLRGLGSVVKAFYDIVFGCLGELYDIVFEYYGFDTIVIFFSTALYTEISLMKTITPDLKINLNIFHMCVRSFTRMITQCTN